ncbi:MarR family winged helix-turn-helix transcriptional regulator [Millisia brevis]|uniref:MarR family winged helix-turn-helix transcriptional regulator n=1 Tax=Millisia brevis TaxID=264148 RepID=UPI000831AA6B|nr:MarR family winged helix-turn-helix transcriptional regulator [Millisia brevis]
MTSTRPDMQPPLQQPIGFWTARAGDAIRRRTRGRLAELGVSQPQWWVLHQLSLHPDGMSRDDMVAIIGPNESDTVIREAIDTAADKHWVRRDGDLVVATDAGRERFRAAAQAQQDLDAERRLGISDDEYATTITVLQRVIRNVGGDAWHW